MPDPPDDTIDWELTTWEGNRRRQHLEFLALSFREKLQRLEDFAEVEALFAARRTVSPGGGEGRNDSRFDD